jgi:hypothetical protein
LLYLCVGCVLNYHPGSLWTASLLLVGRPTSYNVCQIQGRATDSGKQPNRRTIRTLSSGMLVKAARETNF